MVDSSNPLLRAYPKFRVELDTVKVVSISTNYYEL